jgi:NodT family efflux transporter outer membrane factor (OMF) lipoprotein
MMMKVDLMSKVKLWGQDMGLTALTTVVAVASAVLLMTGCASQGPAHTPLALSQAGQLGLVGDGTPGAVAADTAWWSTLGDPALASLIEQALRDQPSLATARSRAQRASALADGTQGRNGPQLGLGADLSRQRYTENGLYPAPIAGGTYDTGNLQVGASWVPDFWGQHSAELAVALGQARAAQADAAAAAQALAAQVAHSYNGLARLLAQRDVAQRALAQRQEMLNLTRQRVGAGLDTQVELAQAQGSVPDARLQREMLDERIALARHQVAVLSGQQPTALAGLSPALAAWGTAAVPAELGADLLGRRPDVVAARWRVEAASQGVAVAKTQFYPNISLSAFIGLNAIGLDKVFESGSRQLGVAPALRLPLFDGGALRAQLSGRQGELDAAVSQYNSQVLDAVREARDAISSLQSLERQWPEQQAALASAERAHQLSRHRYEAGLGSYLIVLNTEGQWLAQRRQAVDLQARQVDARVALLQALGGGWSSTPMPQTSSALVPAALTTAAR